jgi:hypothetical protein
MRYIHMQYDLAPVCRDARAHIDVPSVPLVAIRNAAAKSAGRKTGWLAALVAGISVAAVAGAAAIGTHVALERGGSTVISADRMVVNFKNPPATALQAAVRNANFHVTLPVGLPNGTQLKQLVSAKGAIMLRYDLAGAWRASHHIAWIVLANPDLVGGLGNAGKVSIKIPSHGKPVRWRVGGEEVIVAWNNLTAAELARMKQAMLAASAQK